MEALKILFARIKGTPHCYVCAKEGHFREMQMANKVIFRMSKWDRPWNPTQSCFQCTNCGRLACYTHCDDRKPCDCGAKSWTTRSYIQKELDDG